VSCPGKGVMRIWVPNVAWMFRRSLAYRIGRSRRAGTRAMAGPGLARESVGQREPGRLDLRPGRQRRDLHQAFADVTGLVAQYGSGAWSVTAPAPVGWPRGPQAGHLAGAGYLGWTLVVVTGDPAARSGQVMVLDGAHRVDAVDRGFSVPLDGLLAGQVARVHTVEWTGHGPRFSAFTQPLSARPAVSFPVAGAPYLVGVITAAAPLVNFAPPEPVSRPTAGHHPPAGFVSADAWVTEVREVTNGLQAAGMLGKPSAGRLHH